MRPAPSPPKSGLDESVLVAEAVAEAFVAVAGAGETIHGTGAEAEADAAANAPPAAGLGQVRRSVAADAARPEAIAIATDEAAVDVGMLGNAVDGEVAGGSPEFRLSLIAPSSNFDICPEGCVDCQDCLVHGAAVSCLYGSHPDTCQEEHRNDNGAAPTISTCSSRDCAGKTTAGSKAGMEEENRVPIPNCMRLAGFCGSIRSIVSSDICTDSDAPNCPGARAAAALVE